jgi:hypothetical protein
MLLRRLAFPALIGLAVIGLLAVRGAAQGEVFPTFKGKDLLGGSVSTESFRGKVRLVTVGFERVHAKAIEEWATQFKAAFPDDGAADVFALVVLDGALKLFRGRIDKAMAKDKPERVQRRIMTIYAADSVCRELGVKDRSRVLTYLLDREGRVVYREVGEPTAEAMERVKRQTAALLPDGGVAPAASQSR